MRRQISAAFLLLILAIVDVRGQALAVRLDGNNLRFTGRDLHFITGDSLTRLHNGTSVRYMFRAGLSGERSGVPLTQVIYRFVVSYDLWEEKFAVTRLEPMPRSSSHLSLAAAEAWCMDSIGVPTDNLTADRTFWTSLEYEVEQPAGTNVPDAEDTTLSKLINIFGRKASRTEPGARREGGPFRLTDLRRR